MSFPKYPEYKDSGVEWLGEVPEHWQSKRLKFLFEIQKRDVREGDQIVTCFRDGVVTLRNNRRLEGFTNALKEIGYQGVRSGDLVIHAMDAFAGAIGVSDSDGKSSPVYSVCVPVTAGVSSYYYARLLRYMALSGFVASLAKGIRERSTDFRWSDASDIFMPVPTADEQAKIAKFLDHETARIDALVEQQQRLIELLKEKRQAVISHAVTKGLAPDVPMKDSGVEWLGEVPAHWEVVKLGYLAISQGGGTPPKDDLQYWNGNIPWVTPKDMKQQWITSTIDTLSEGALHASPVSMIEPGHVLIVFRSGILRHRIPAAINKVPVTVNQDLRAYNVKPRLLPAFFLRLTQGLNRELLPEWSKQGATVESLDSELVSSTQLPVPPRAEQEAITSFLDHETVRIDALVEEGESVINLLQERRSALISAAVTGKIDVRSWQPPEGSTASSEATQTEAV